MVYIGLSEGEKTPQPLLSRHEIQKFECGSRKIVYVRPCPGTPSSARVSKPVLRVQQQRRASVCTPRQPSTHHGPRRSISIRGRVCATRRGQQHVPSTSARKHAEVQGCWCASSRASHTDSLASPSDHLTKRCRQSKLSTEVGAPGLVWNYCCSSSRLIMMGCKSRPREPFDFFRPLFRAT